MRLAPLVVAALMLWAPSALAQTPEPNAPQAAPPLDSPPVPAKPPQAVSPPSGRFAFSRVETGFLRLDTQTGQVALCRAHSAGGWACEAVPEERAALEKEIARLQDEVTGLKREFAALQPPLPPRPPAPDTGDKKAPLVSDEDIARARTFVEETWRRLVEMLMNFQKDVMRKT